MATKTMQFRVELDGKTASRLNSALKALGETDAPFLRAALDDVGARYLNEIRARAKGSLKGGARARGVTGQANTLKFSGFVGHPAAKALEFGRQYYYRGYKGRAQKTGQRFKSSPGMRAQPYVGIKNKDQATGATSPYARERLTEAIAQEWERLGSEA